MSQPLRILHGEFGRLMLVQLNEPVGDQAGRFTKFLFKIGGADLNVCIGGKTYRLSLNEVVMINAGECHSCACTDASAASLVLTIEVDSKWGGNTKNRLANRVSRHLFREKIGRVPAVAQGAVAELADVLACELILSTEKIESLVTEIVLLLAEHYSDTAETGRFALMAEAACDSRIRKALAIMAATVGEPVLVEELARAAQVSRPHFFHLFKKETQLTPAVYANMLRMAQAVYQISETVESLETIALNLGFESQGNFTRFFKNHQGFLPSQYRRKVAVLPRRCKVAPTRQAAEFMQPGS